MTAVGVGESKRKWKNNEALDFNGVTCNEHGDHTCSCKLYTIEPKAYAIEIGALSRIDVRRGWEVVVNQNSRMTKMTKKLKETAPLIQIILRFHGNRSIVCTTRLSTVYYAGSFGSTVPTLFILSLTHSSDTTHLSDTSNISLISYPITAKSKIRHLVLVLNILQVFSET